LSDSTGKPAAVVIPIKEWEILKEKHRDLQLLEKSSDFAGTLHTDVAEKMQKSVEESRNEWNSNKEIINQKTFFDI
jgi:PHD/YefM family antitoxin component YafN of YafNO toxin-antitoxin module